MHISNDRKIPQSLLNNQEHPWQSKTEYIYKDQGNGVYRAFESIEDVIEYKNNGGWCDRV